MKEFFLALFLMADIFLIQSQNIEIKGNGLIISSNGSNVPSPLDGTSFADTPVKGVRTQVFSITNLDGQNDVKIKRITVNSTEFTVGNKIKNLKKGETQEFEIVFEPSSIATHTAIVSIESMIKKEEFTSIFNIAGLSSEEIVGGNLMISQYYENGANDHIEIKNLTDAEIKDKTYVLAVYRANDDIGKAPKKGNSIDIGSMSSEEVRLFSNLSLNGNDMIILSTSKGKDCYKDRVDMIGIQNVMWGAAISFTKGGCSTERAHINFDQNHWVVLENLKVDQAAGSQNIALGTYQLGPAYWTGSSWVDNTLPDLSRIVYIENDYDGNLGNIEACDLIINADVDFDQGGKNSVVVYGDLTINGSLSFGDKESLVMYDDLASVIGNITKRESSTYRNSAYDFTYWSSPISNGQISKVFEGVSPGRIFYYDQSKTSSSDPSAPDYWNSWVNAGGNLAPGRGYAAEGVSGTIGVHEVDFNGKPNNGVIFEDIHFWNDANLDNDFNLIGNPYPSAIDIEAFFDVNNSVIDPAIYLWTHNTIISNGDSGDFSSSDYATYNYTGGTGVGSGVGDGPIPDKNIGSSQGFFIRAIASGQVIFNNAMRMEDANDQFFKRSGNKVLDKNAEKDRIWLNLTTDQGGFNQLLIGFMDKASAGLDRGYDAIKHEGPNKIGFYSVVDDKKLAIQGLGSFLSDQEIVLGFDSKVVNRIFTISIGKTEGALQESGIYLVDHLLGVTHDLKGSDYVFEQTSAGVFKDRFSLKFKQETALSVADTYKENRLWVYNNDDLFTVKSSKVVNTIRIYDVLGKLVLETHPNDTSFELYETKARKGELLFMHLTLDNHITLKKKLIKQ